MNTSEIMKKIADSEFYKSIVQEEIDQAIEARKEMAASITTLDKESMKTAKEFHAKFSKKEDELQVAKDRVKQLKREKLIIENDWGILSNMYCHTKTCLENDLRKTADSRIDDALYLFHKKYESLRAKEPCYSSGTGKRNWATLAFDVEHYSNVQSIEDGLEYTRQGSEELKKMQLEPILDEKKLKKLISGVSKKTEWMGIR